MPFAPRDKSRLVGLLAADGLLPVQEMRARNRHLVEERLIAANDGPLSGEHVANIVVALLASPTHVDAPGIVRQFAAFPCVSIAPRSDHEPSLNEVVRLLPELLRGTLQDVLVAVLEGLGLENPAFDVVDNVWAELPPHNRFGFRIRPAGLLPVDVVFAEETGVGRQMKVRPERRLKQRQSFDGTVLAMVAEFLTTAGESR